MCTFIDLHTKNVHGARVDFTFSINSAARSLAPAAAASERAQPAPEEKSLSLTALHDVWLD